MHRGRCHEMIPSKFEFQVFRRLQGLGPLSLTTTTQLSPLLSITTTTPHHWHWHQTTILQRQQKTFHKRNTSISSPFTFFFNPSLCPKPSILPSPRTTTNGTNHRVYPYDDKPQKLAGDDVFRLALAPRTKRHYWRFNSSISSREWDYGGAYGGSAEVSSIT